MGNDNFGPRTRVLAKLRGFKCPTRFKIDANSGASHAPS